MDTMRVVSRVALAGLLLVMVAACASDDSDDPSGTSSPSKSAGTPLLGTQWTLIDSPDVPAVGVTVTAEFADGRITGSSGCNTYNGPFEVSGSQLTIGPEIAGTRMACDRLPTAVEAAYLALLPRVATFEISGTTLRLFDETGEELLIYDASDGASAIIGSWTVTSYYTGSAVQSVITGSTLTAEFDESEVSGDGGCNGFGGPYETEGSTITIGPFRSTLKACADEALGTQEQQYLAALELAATYRVTPSTLGLLREDGGVAATFERAAGSD